MNLNGLHLTFDDEFDSFVASPDGSIGWMTSYPFGGEEARTLTPNGELEYYSDSSVGTNPFAINNGVLDITAQPAAPGSNPYNLPYTSGVITTYTSFAQLYGFFEIRAELPAGAGLWPAFWMLPASNVNTAELDVFEVLDGKPTTLYVTTHDTVTGTDTGIEQPVTVPNTTTGFHTYGVDWEPTTITFYFDGQAVATAPTPASMNVPMYMLVDLAVGGTWGGAPTSASEFPATLQVDYVRAYATANTTDVSGSDAIELGWLTGQVVSNGVAQTGVSVQLLTYAGSVYAQATSGVGGAFSFSSVPIGSYRVQYTLPSGAVFVAAAVLTAGQTVALTPASFAAGATISGSITYAGAGEAGLTVTLQDSAGNPVATATTAANGSYSFTGLLAGSYQLAFTAPAGQVLQPGSQANIATGVTASFAVAAGQSVAVPAEVLVAAASVSGTVLLDGLAVAGAAVELLSSGGTVLASTTSAADGSYSFTGLQTGSYQLLFTPLAGTVLQTGSLASSATGLTAPIGLATGQALNIGSELLLDNPGEIQGSTHHFGGATDPSWGSGQGGITVNLVSAAGVVIATTTTSSGGWFAFTNLAAGLYQLDYLAPTGLALQSGGPANTATGLTGAITLAAGQNLGVPIEGLVSTTGIAGQVLLAGAGEAQVTVKLLNAAGAVVATTTTGITGSFAFNALAAGSYQVQYVAPSGQILVPGNGVAVATGLSGSIALAVGASVTLPAETLAFPAVVEGTIKHFGSADPIYGSGQSGVVVALLNAAGAVVASSVSSGSGWFGFNGVAPGSYQLQYSLPAGEALQPGGPAAVGSGLTAAFTVAPGQALWVATVGAVSSSNSFTLTGSGAVALRGDGNYVITGNASNSKLVLGAGNQSVTLSGAGNSVVTGAGNQAIVLAGSGNSVTIGAGTSTVAAGSGGATVHAAGGNVSITAGGANNLFDSGAGTNFLYADGSAGNAFMLNAAGQGLTTISGFSLGTTDVLDLVRTLGGVAIAANLANVGSFITAAAGAGGTTLYADVDANGHSLAPTAFAMLSGVTTSVAQLLAGGQLEMV